MSKTLAAFIAVTICLTSAAHAGLVVNIVKVVDGAGFGNPEAALNGYSSYAVTLSTDAGEVISAIDAAFTGPLHQRWTDQNFDNAADPTPQGPLAGNNRGDTSMTPIAGALIGAAPAEDNSGAGSPLAGAPPATVYGHGTFLTGAWGIDGAAQSANADVAYLVIPDGQAVDYALAVSGNSGGQAITFPTVQGQVGNVIPEPTTFALAGLGMIGVITRRRRS